MTKSVSDLFRVRVVAPGLGSTPSWALAQPIGQWYTVPNTAPSLVPEPAQPGIPGNWQYGPGKAGARLGAWSGPTFRQKDSVFILGPTGGHGDYYMNWLSRTVLGVENPYTELLDPGSPWQKLRPSAWLSEDLKPFAYHTYWSVQYCNQRDWHICFEVERHDANTAPWSSLPPMPSTFVAYDVAAAGNTNHVMVFDYVNRVWLPPYTIPDLPTTPAGLQTAAPTCTHPVTGDIYYNRPGASNAGLWAWRQATNSYVRIGNDGPVSYRALAIDPTRNQMFQSGGYPYDPDVPTYPWNQTAFGPRIWDLRSGSSQNLLVTGPARDIVHGKFEHAAPNYPSITFSYAGAHFSSALDRYILCTMLTNRYPNPALREKTVLISINPTTWHAEIVATTNDLGLGAGADGGSGIQTRFHISEQLRGVVLMDRYNEGIKYCRLW